MRTTNEKIFLSESVQKAGHQLLDHQCWVLGRDVLSSAGNLLCEYGFRQVRCPNGGLTQYELKNGLGANSHVYLWGFGVLFGNETEGIFLSRNKFKPSQTLGKVELHSKEDPNFGDETFRLDLFLEGMEWFAKYEQWISGRMPDEYRELCLSTFPRRALPGAGFSQRWKTLANNVKEEQHLCDVYSQDVYPQNDLASPPSFGKIIQN